MPFRIPDIAQSVTHVSSEIIIDAPLKVVWHAILDFPLYEKWNPVVRSQVITDSTFQPLEPQPKPAEGTRLLMRVCLPPAGPDLPASKGLLTSHEVITILDEEYHRVGWTQVAYPRWLVETHRLQEVTEVEVDAKKMTKYSTLVVWCPTLKFKYFLVNLL